MRPRERDRRAADELDVDDEVVFMRLCFFFRPHSLRPPGHPSAAALAMRLFLFVCLFPWRTASRPACLHLL